MNRIPSRERATRRPREGEKRRTPRVVLVAVKLDVDDDTEHLKREVEAIAYVVGRYCRLDTTVSVFYLSAWETDDPEVVRDWLGRISRTTKLIISVPED